MKKIRQVLRLTFEAHQSRRVISLSLGISRDAVSDYLTRAAAAGLSWPLPPDLDDCELERRLFPVLTAMEGGKPLKAEADWAEIHLSLKKTKGATLQELHKEYLVDHPDGMAYSYFCQRYREFAKTLKRWMRQIHIAGDRVFVDYAGPTFEIIEAATGEIRQAQVFVAVLGASGYIYAEASWSQGLPYWIASHVRMFNHFGGVPAVVVCDNLKSAVTRASRTDPVIQATYQDMAEHYETIIIPARPYKPRDKAHAENGVLIVERWIIFRLRKRVFTSLAELNQAIHELLVDVNNRPFQKLPGCRRSAFESLDKPALKPLPETKYIYAEFRRTRVGFDYHLELDDRHFYSVPYALVRREVDVRLTAETVEILHGGRRIASHARINVPGKTTIPEHMDPSHRYLEEWNSDKGLDWAQEVGAKTHAFLQVVLSQQARRQLAMRSVDSLKSLGKEFGAVRLEAACTRALAAGASKTSSVRSILKTNLDRRSVAITTTNEANFDHGNIRGSDYYH